MGGRKAEGAGRVKAGKWNPPPRWMTLGGPARGKPSMQLLAFCRDKWVLLLTSSPPCLLFLPASTTSWPHSTWGYFLTSYRRTRARRVTPTTLNFALSSHFFLHFRPWSFGLGTMHACCYCIALRMSFPWVRFRHFCFVRNIKRVRGNFGWEVMRSSAHSLFHLSPWKKINLVRLEWWAGASSHRSK